MSFSTREERHARILQAGSLPQLLDEPQGVDVLRAEAADDPDHRLIDPRQLDYLLALRAEARRADIRPQLFGNVADVIIVPGFLGSSLTDSTGPHGLIWIDPTLVLGSSEQLQALQLQQLGRFTAAQLPSPERDLQPGVTIHASGALPAQYDLLAWDLEFRRFATSIFAFDWRKDLERAAMSLADQIRARDGQRARPLHIIAHSQGSLVARRALQLLGATLARRLVNNLVLLGPASYGSFSAAFAFTGNNSAIELMQRFGVEVDFKVVLQSFTGLYQLLPWNKDNFENGFDPDILAEHKNWTLGIDRDRLQYGFKWGQRLNTEFFNDRTSIILGDVPMKGAVEFQQGRIVEIGNDVSGDGTVTDANARLKGVRTYRMPAGKHAMLPMYPAVIAAVRTILRGETPALSPALRMAGATTDDSDSVQWLRDLSPPAQAAPQPSAGRKPARAAASASGKPAPPIAEASTVDISPLRPAPPAPDYRCLRVFSFDPLLATNLRDLGIAVITLQLPWDGGNLLPGPVGEYIEVIDFDPASRRFYHPVDLNDVRIVAQDGLTPAESNPQFHQQMVYAVAMATVTAFEQGLGRSALWAPRFERDEFGNVIAPVQEEATYVPRLRIYPHALREANAFYDPQRHALLFGYFPSHEQPGGETLPGGVVFTSQSYDIIAHETTHALLHGLHRYYLTPSNPDVLAFHEAFADAVALFSKFSHVEVVRHQIARTRGDLKQDNLLGQLAQQFGRALGGHRGALRQYINTPPDPALYSSTEEPHDRGAILMAALFRAFLNIYEHRTRDLHRLATHGTGVHPDGDIPVDLVNRLAEDASKSARHLLNMCIRALDYVPPVDITFGEFLRALITADYELVRDDDQRYRVAVIDAFRSWGLYPDDVNVLDQSAMLWRQPVTAAANGLREVLEELDLRHEDLLNRDRRAIYLQMRRNCYIFRSWIYAAARENRDGMLCGIMAFGRHQHSIPRNARNAPKFEVHSCRTCQRIGPDGQQQRDVVVEIVQKRAGYFDPEIQKQVDEAEEPWAFSAQEAEELQRPRAPDPDFWHRGGCTLIIDPGTSTIRYSISKRAATENDRRLDQQRAFALRAAEYSPAATYFGPHDQNPFAVLHTGDQTGDIYGT